MRNESLSRPQNFKPVYLLAGIMLLTGCGVLILPSNMVHLAAHATPGQIQDVNSGTPEGTGGGLFTVPDGKVLVITRVIIHPRHLGPGELEIEFIQSAGGLPDRINQTWWVTNSSPNEFDFTPGYVISSGSSLKIKNETSSSGEVIVAFTGYVTADK